MSEVVAISIVYLRIVSTTKRMVSSSLTRKFTGSSSFSPAHRVAQQLEWNPHKLLLTMVVRRKRLSLALAGHPHKNTVERLPDIESLHPNLLHHYALCGVVVEWPITNTGVLGAQCGRVLHTLEAMELRLPVCLHSIHAETTVCEDAWGRLPRYGQPAPTHKTTHVASLEQYGDDASAPCVVQDVWRTYAMRHWPLTHDEINCQSISRPIPPVTRGHCNLLHYVP